MSIIKTVTSALFSSKAEYMDRQLNGRNLNNSFPLNNSFSLCNFTENCYSNSCVISGGYDYVRARTIYSLLTANLHYDVKVVFHNSSPMFTDVNLTQNGIPAKNFSGNVLTGTSRAELLTQISRESNPELSIFWNYAFDVCEALGKPLSVHSIKEIDWLSIDWQQQVLMLSDRDIAMDLLQRFDAEMSKLAVKATIELERMTRAYSSNKGSNFADIINSGSVLSVNIQGNRVIEENIMESLLALAQQGKSLYLVFDNTLDVTHPLVTQKNSNICTVISFADITTLTNWSNFISNGANILLFKHIYGSAQKLSEHCFGYYDNYESERSYTKSRQRGVFSTINDSVTQSVRKKKELRLLPETIANLYDTVGVTKMLNLGEGVVYID